MSPVKEKNRNRHVKLKIHLVLVQVFRIKAKLMFKLRAFEEAFHNLF